MTIDHFLLILLVQTILSGLVAILSLIRFQSRDPIIRLIGFIFLIGCLANIVGWLLVKTVTFRAFTNVAGLVYIMSAVCLYSRVYFIAFHKRNAIRFVLLAIAFLIFALVNLFFIQKTKQNSYTYLLNSSTFIVYTLLYFYALMKDLPSLHLHQLPMFWFNTGLLIFHAGTFFLMAFVSYLVNVMKDNLLVYWSFHNVLSIIEHFIFLIGLYYDLKLRKGNLAPLSYR